MSPQRVKVSAPPGLPPQEQRGLGALEGEEGASPQRSGAGRGEGLSPARPGGTCGETARGRPSARGDCGQRGAGKEPLLGRFGSPEPARPKGFRGVGAGPGPGSRKAPDKGRGGRGGGRTWRIRLETTKEPKFGFLNQTRPGGARAEFEALARGFSSLP